MHLLTEDCLNYYFTKEDIAIAKDYYDNGCIKKIGVMRENDGIFSRSRPATANMIVNLRSIIMKKASSIISATALLKKSGPVCI